MTERVGVGRIVHVDGSDGGCRPAIITHVFDAEGGIVNVVVISDGSYDSGSPPARHATSLTPGQGPGHWHWPERI